METGTATLRLSRIDDGVRWSLPAVMVWVWMQTVSLPPCTLAGPGMLPTLGVLGFSERQDPPDAEPSKARDEAHDETVPPGSEGDAPSDQPKAAAPIELKEPAADEQENNAKPPEAEERKKENEKEKEKAEPIGTPKMTGVLAALTTVFLMPANPDPLEPSTGSHREPVATTNATSQPSSGVRFSPDGLFSGSPLPGPTGFGRAPAPFGSIFCPTANPFGGVGDLLPVARSPGKIGCPARAVRRP